MIGSALFPLVSSPRVSFPARIWRHRPRSPGRRAPELRRFAYLADMRAVVRETLARVVPTNRRVVRQGVSVEVSSKNYRCASWKFCHCLCDLIPEVLLVFRRSIFLWCIPCKNCEVSVCLPVFDPDSPKPACHRSRRVVSLYNLSSSDCRLTNGILSKRRKRQNCLPSRPRNS